MRKIHQKMILDLLRSLGEANDNAKKLLQKKETQTLTNLLADCQDTAIQIGEFIQRSENSEKVTVKYIQEYCDLLYYANDELAKPDSGAGVIKKLQKQIFKIENSVNSELKPDKIEIAFFPYKASMWDSLESIWFAAKDDPACDAYVVPIPYYDLLPDKQLGRMHYEGKQYPDYVPVTDWQEYNIEERRPDVIFIHYPYDDAAQNATVQPDFYAKRLREYCDLLIYVPYFVSAGDTVPEYNIALPGVLFSNHVIVQSEKIRQSYIDQFKKYNYDYGWKGQFGKPEEKFIALGSPKFDKVINAKREDFVIPQEWERLIRKPDGSAKKVVLYNTHMFTWINGGAQYFKKLRDVFDTFSKRDDVVLWWRPHPNTELNFRTMCPHLLGQYEKTVSDYKSGGWGIYDDTADLNRAIACSDAYYGDGGSLVALYQCTGKPMMYQNYKTSEHFVNRAACSWWYDDGENFWFVHGQFNALFKMPKVSLIPEYIGSFPDERFDDRPYVRAAQNGDKLYFSPWMAKEIAVFDIKTKTFEKISFRKESEEVNLDRSFLTAFSKGKYIFFTPYKYPAIIRLDTQTNELAFFDDWLAPLQKLITNTVDNEKDIFFHAPYFDGKTIWLPAYCGNAVVAFDTETLVSVVHTAGRKSYQYGGICFDGENFWLTPRYDTPVVKWHPQKGVLRELPNPCADAAKKCYPFYSAYCGGFVWLLPYQVSSINIKAVKIDVKTDTVYDADEFAQEVKNPEDVFYSWCTYYHVFVANETIYAASGVTGNLIEYDCLSKERKESPIIYSPEVITELREKLESSSAEAIVYNEDTFITLPALINRIVKARAIHNSQQALRQISGNTDGTAGKEIYEHCKNNVFERNLK
ncbi:MAG: hypothetical protein LBI42_01955 [Chitinispirillales bacterium]|jgi:hypothetical protein|nr:hypothetical protein [Chitinispirillales bacterium]